MMKQWASNIFAAFKRFPLPALCSLLFFLVAIRLQDGPSTGYSGILTGHAENVALAILCCGYFWFIALKLFAESRRWNWGGYYLVGLSIFSIIAWYLYTVPMLCMVAAFFSFAFFLAMLVAPFLKKGTTGLQLWSFQYQFCLHLCLTIFAAVLLYLGIAAILSSLSFLFGVKISYLVYVNTFFGVAFFFAPVFAMAGIPVRFDGAGAGEISRVIRIVVPYIVIPLLLIYGIVLYGYIYKIIAAGTLPKGGVFYLVSAFGISGIMTYFLSYPLHSVRGITALFGRYFAILLLLPLGLLAVSISVRVQEYGITPNRYVILLCFVWLILSVLFMLFKSQHVLRNIMFSLAMMFIFASFGPWSIYNLSAWSQLGKLNTLIQKKSLSHAEQVSMSSIVDYLVQNQEEGLIKPRYTQFSPMQKSALIMQDLGFTYLDYSARQISPIENIFFTSRWLDQPVIVIAGYDYIVNVDFNNQSTPVLTAERSLDEHHKLLITFDSNLNRYTVERADTKERLLFDIEPLLQKIKQLPQSQFLFMDQAMQNFQARLIINNVSGTRDKASGKYSLSWINATLLIKKL